MNYATLAPIIEGLQTDPRVELFFTATETPHELSEVYAEARGPYELIGPRAAAFMHFDSYLTADSLWARLPRGTRRVQTFHGVAGKLRSVYDSPAQSMRGWHRLFFINKRRLHHFIKADAIDADSPAIRLIGMPRVDCLVDGSLERDQVLTSLGIDPSRRTVLYAPTWSKYSSLPLMGEQIVKRLGDAGYAVIVKLHDRSRQRDDYYSGGDDWGERLMPLLRDYGGVLATGSNSSPYLAGGDVLITDHSSVGFEYLLLDRPLVRIHVAELLKKTDIEPVYVQLMSEAATSVADVDQVIAAVENNFAEPQRKSDSRKAVAAEMFYKPGTATQRAIAEMYDVLELTPPENGEKSTPLTTKQELQPPQADEASNYRGIKIHAVPSLHEQCSSLIETLPLPVNARVLDLGAGEGAFTLRLMDAGFEVTAVELEGDRFSLDARCRALDLNLDFDDNWNHRFHLIVAIEIIEHLNNPRHFIRNCLRVLTPDGFLLVTSPNVESWLSRIRFLRDGRFLWFEESDYSSYGHIAPVFSWQMRQICSELGAELVQVKNTRNSLLRKRLGQSLSGVLRNKAFYLSALYPLMKGQKDGEIGIYLIRKGHS